MFFFFTLNSKKFLNSILIDFLITEKIEKLVFHFWRIPFIVFAIKGLSVLQSYKRQSLNKKKIKKNNKSKNFFTKLAEKTVSYFQTNLFFGCFKLFVLILK